MNGKPLENVQLAESLLTIFATRIATELERQQSEASLQQVSAQLEQQLQRFDAIASSVTDYIYTFDLSGRFTYVNQPLLDLWQRPLELAISKNLHELANHLEDCIQRVIANRQPLKDEATYTSFQGTGIYEYVFVPLFSKDRTVEGVAGISRDITDRKRIEFELQAQKAELIGTTNLLELRNQELNQFSYAVSHDLKAPLRGITNLSQWIEDDLGTVAPEVQANLELMRSRIQRMDNLIDGLLEYALDTLPTRRLSLRLRHP